MHNVCDRCVARIPFEIDWCMSFCGGPWNWVNAGPRVSEKISNWKSLRCFVFICRVCPLVPLFVLLAFPFRALSTKYTHKICENINSIHLNVLYLSGRRCEAEKCRKNHHALLLSEARLTRPPSGLRKFNWQVNHCDWARYCPPARENLSIF